MKTKYLKFLPLTAMLSVSLAGALAATGCSDDNSTTTTAVDAGHTDAAHAADTGAAATDGTFEVNLTYTGTKKGPAICTAWTVDHFPGPTDTPVGLGSNETPTWPGTNKVTITQVPPGKVYALCYIMVGAEHRMGPTAGDPSQPMMAPGTPELVAGGTSVATATLLDPQPAGDGGADGGDGGR